MSLPWGQRLENGEVGGAWRGKLRRHLYYPPKANNIVIVD